MPIPICDYSMNMSCQPSALSCKPYGCIALHKANETVEKLLVLIKCRVRIRPLTPLLLLVCSWTSYLICYWKLDGTWIAPCLSPCACIDGGLWHAKRKYPYPEQMLERNKENAASLQLHVPVIRDLGYYAINWPGQQKMFFLYIHLW